MNEENQTFEKEVEKENHQAPDHACANWPVLPAVLTAAAESLAEIDCDPVRKGSSGPMCAFIFIFNRWMIGGFWIADNDCDWNSDILIEAWRDVSRALHSSFVGRWVGGLAVSVSNILVGWRSVLQLQS